VSALLLRGLDFRADNDAMNIVYSFLLAFGTSLLLTPAMRWLALRVGIMDRPGIRKVHRKPVPYLGGVAIFIGFALASLSLSSDPQVIAIVVGAACVVVLGVIDDAIAMPAVFKLVGQIAIACGTYWAGVSISHVTHPFGGVVYLGGWDFPVTVMWIVSMMNTVNLMDGLDGLAAGVGAISAMAITIIAVQTGLWPAAIISVALAGSSLAFLRYNFTPASIFMGDAGSMFLGYALATATMIGVLKSAFTISIAIPILALAVPIFDTVFAIIRRLRRGQPVFSPDKEHFHHQLMSAGLSPKQAVILIYAASFCLGVTAVALGFFEGMDAVIFLVVTTIVMVITVRYFRRNARKIRQVVEMISD